MIYTLTLNPSIDYIVQLESLTLGEINRIGQDFKFPGGKGINVSRILQRLGKKNIALGFLGGFTGEFIRQQIEQEGIVSHFTSIKADTRINIKLKAQTETEINGQGPHLSADEIANLKQKLAQVTENDLVILSGSIPPSLPSSFYNELIEIIKTQGAEFVLDTTSNSLLDALSFNPILVKPNHHELADMFQTEFHSIAEMLPFGQELLTRGAQHVLLSLGKDGALLFTPTGIYQSEPIIGELKNSVGAGDSMIAGFVSQLHQNQPDILAAFRYGLACGSATAFSDDLADSDTILTLVKEVKINQIN